MRPSRLHLLYLSTALSLTAAAVQAAPAPTAADQPAALEEVVVTAQRQSENLQTTPLSVAAFTGPVLRERGVSTIEGLASQTPSLAVKTDFGSVNPNIYIRGVGISDINANVTGAVGVYVDEVYKASPAGQLLQFYDVDRVEVLRGPQGTLYGRNTTGGAINILSKAPTEAMSADVMALYGRYNELQVEGGVGGALIPDKLLIRISGAYHARDGFIRNTNTAANSLAPGRVADIGTWATRVQLEYRASEAVNLRLGLHYAESDSSGAQFKDRGLLDPAAFAQGRVAPCGPAQLAALGCVDSLGYRDATTSPNQVEINGPTNERVRVWGSNLRAAVQGDGLALTAITAYENTHRTSIFDIDDSPNSLIDAVQSPHSWQLSQELRLASTKPGDRFRWVVGAFYFEEQLDFAGSFDLFRGVRPAIAAAATALGLGPPLSFGFNPGGGPALAAQLGSPIFAYPTFFGIYDYTQDVQSWAGFGQAYFDIADRLTATLGLRYSDERRRFDYQSGFSEPFVFIPLAQNSAALHNDRTSFNDLSWRLALEWRATDAIFGYASINRGSKSGGFNGAFLTSQAQTRPFADETLTSYEIGAKTELFDRRLRLNVTGFYYNYKDLQVYTLENNGGIPQQVLSNAPTARVSGAEIELLARPVEPLAISLGASLLDTEITSDFVGGSGVNLRGNQLAYAPRLSTNGSVTWTQPLGGAGGALVFATDFSRQSATFTDTRNLERLRTQAALILGARVAYRNPDGRWEVAAWGRNLTDKRNITGVGDLSDFGFDRLRYNAPATYGMSVQVRY